jgi:cell division protein FtsI/penicillin-binding protein 2
MASVYASIGSGKIVKPYMVKEIKDRNGEVLYEAKPEVIGDVPLSPENLEIVRSALREVVLRGTGVATRFTGIPAAGKTGTAENPGEAHAWFICYAPYPDPEIVICAFVAHGEHGDRASAYVARDILKWYKINRVKREFPPDGPFSQYIVQRGKIRVPYRGKPRED